MARASRSNKKQPAFDPSELEDLIFSPAVGKGVGSHLVRGMDQPTVVTSSVSSQRLDLPTVAETDLTTVASSIDLTTLRETRHLSTVDEIVLSTVDRSDSSENDAALPRPVSPRAAKLWITEGGDLVPEARVRKIRLAQDVINSAEESVYDTLWNAKLLQTDEAEACRIVQAGYDYLVKRTRLARKTIQRIVAKLLEKDFIVVETRADIYQRTATVYRVFSYKAVLDKHVKKGRLYVAKMGPGFSYAKPLETLPEQGSDMTTVDMSNVMPVVKTNVPTVDKETTVTVVKMDRPTVVKMSGYLLDTSLLDNTSSSAIRQELSQYGPVDDDVMQQLMTRCRELAADCTGDEILHFIREKSGLIQKKKGNVYNPLGFLLTAVPRCFTNDNLRAYRAEKNRQQQGEIRELEAMERWRREQEASLSDPSVSEQEKHLIRLCLGLNTGQ